MMTTVIYHSADYDGIFCREIAKYFLGEKDVQYIGWNFGDFKIPYPEHGNVYVMDISPECLQGLPNRAVKTLIWIDHHKTSIEKWSPDIYGYRIDGVAACRLAWQWFFSEYGPNGDPRIHPSDWHLPEKEDFINRKVNEPLAVRLAGEYDVWDKRDSKAETLQYALRTEDPFWESLFKQDGYCEAYLQLGVKPQKYAQKVDADICNHLTWLMEWEGLKFLCVNHARFNSLLFAAKDKPETGHDALLGFRFDGKNWMVSLYHANHRKDLDLSIIAKKYGGGGHKGACGFTCTKLPF